MNILLIGAGALGAEIVDCIVDLGLPIDLLTIVDHDLVEESNLNRQAIFTIDTINQPKAQVLSLHCSNNGLNSEAIVSRIEEQPMSLMEGRDVIIMALDNIPSRLYVNECIFCLPARTFLKVLECGTQGWNGHCRLLTFNSCSRTNDPCIMCTLSLYATETEENDVPICTFSSKEPTNLKELLRWTTFSVLPLRHPFLEVDLCNLEHLQMIIDLTLEEADGRGIDCKEQLTLEYCKNELGRVIPSISTTTTYVAAMALELLLQSPSKEEENNSKNFIYYNGELHPPSRTELLLVKDDKGCPTCTFTQL